MIMSLKGIILMLTVGQLIIGNAREAYAMKKTYITPKQSSGCPRDAHTCLTLSDAVQNFRTRSTALSDNEMVAILPGKHVVTLTGQITIANVRNITIIGSYKGDSVIHCQTAFGFAFVNVTNMILSNIKLSSCGYPTPEHNFLPNIAYRADYHKKLSVVAVINATNVSITGMQILNSTGTGIMAINMLGRSHITQSLLDFNKPNCVLLFSDPIHNSNYSMPLNTLLSVKDSNFINGRTTVYTKDSFASGLDMVFAQSEYSVVLNISNVTCFNNNGWLHGNIKVYNYECNRMHTTLILADGVNCSKSSEGLVLESRKCRGIKDSIQKPGHFEMKMMNSYFNDNDANGIKLQRYTHTGNFTGYIMFGNITLHQNIVEALEISNFKSITLANIDCRYNTGVAVEIRLSSIVIQGNNNFVENRGSWGAIVLWKSNVSFEGSTTFQENYGEAAGALYAHSSRLELKGKCLFLENEGYNGGAIALYASSILFVGRNSMTNFTRNHAKYFGGAIYVDYPNDFKYLFRYEVVPCFYQVIDIFKFQIWNKKYFNLIENTANDAGSAVYGGWIKYCIETEFNTPEELYLTPVKFDDLFRIQTNGSDLSPISSNPVRVCTCINSTPDCRIDSLNFKVYPGQIFKIPVAAVGQRSGVVPSVVYSDLSDATSTTLDSLQHTQEVGKNCTNLRYTLRSADLKVTMKLTAGKLHSPVRKANHIFHQSYFAEDFRDLNVIFFLQPCPLGFVLLGNSTCTCDHELQKHDISCNIDDQKINREAPFWINATFVDNQTGVVVHEHCPFDYCKSHHMNISLENPDEQCAYNRSGVLCGACQQNLSHVLGSSNCKECSNYWLFLLIPFALIGVLLVVFLMLLNLTVSVGTINGLILYANIVRANQAVFFPPGTGNPFLSWFIAWINLDTGFEVCLFNGLSAYSKTWLQFVFPIYIWLIVITIIVSSHYFTTAAKLSGRNAVPVLATLFLLSYAKLLRFTITAFSSTVLKYGRESIHQRVWLYDGNVEYLKSRHIPLFTAAFLLLLILSVPYTATLLFIQCLQRKSQYKALFWVRKLKPLIDAYIGPYEDKHRYWTGLLLLVRVVLFLIFSANVLGDAAINLLAINVVTACLLVYVAFVGGVYKAWYSNAIEYSFFLNICILSSGTLYNRLANGNQVALTYTSVSTALFTFGIVVIYQASTKFGSLAQLLGQIASTVRRVATRPNVPDITGQLPHTIVQNNQQVPITYIQLREPVLEFCD